MFILVFPSSQPRLRARAPSIFISRLPPSRLIIGGIGSLTAHPPQATYEYGTTNRLHLIAGLA